jgi:hypothetical protein
VVFVGPTLNILPRTPTDTNMTNRALYIGMGGLCLVAGSFADAFGKTRAGRRALPVVAGLALAALVPITWVQLQPWVQASQQSRQLVEEVGRTLPPLTNKWVTVNVAGLPDDWTGAYLFRNGFDSALIRFYNILPRVNKLAGTADLRPEGIAQTVEGTYGTYNLSVTLDPATLLYRIADIAATTDNLTGLPEGAIHVWDFRGCSGGAPLAWTIAAAAAECTPDGLRLRPTSDDAQMDAPGLGIDLHGARWVRMAAAVRYPAVTDQRMLGTWFWDSGEQGGWAAERSRSFYLASDGEWHIYWTYLPASEIGPRLDALRFDPLNGTEAAQVGWIALSIVSEP